MFDLSLQNLSLVTQNIMLSNEISAARTEFLRAMGVLIQQAGGSVTITRHELADITSYVMDRRDSDDMESVVLSVRKEKRSDLH